VPGPDGRDLKRDEVIGLETSDGAERLVPRTLFRRWRLGGLPDQRLPGLLHRLEPQLRRPDFRPLPSLLAFGILAAVPCAVMLALLAAYLMPILELRLSPGERLVLLAVGGVIFAPFFVLLAVLALRPRLRERRLVAVISAAS
jgi:hypothetical protein